MSSGDSGAMARHEEPADRAPVRLAVLDDHEVLLDSLGTSISS